MPLYSGQLVSDQDWKLGQIADLVGGIRDRRQRKRMQSEEQAWQKLQFILESSEGMKTSDFARFDQEVKDLSNQVGMPQIYELAWEQRKRGAVEREAPENLANATMQKVDTMALQGLPEAGPWVPGVHEQPQGPAMGGFAALQRLLEQAPESQRLEMIDALASQNITPESLMSPEERESADIKKRTPHGLTPEQWALSNQQSAGIVDKPGAKEKREREERRLQLEERRVGLQAKQDARAEASHKLGEKQAKVDLLRSLGGEGGEAVEEDTTTQRGQSVEAEEEFWLQKYEGLGLRGLSPNERTIAKRMLRTGQGDVRQYVQEKILNNPENLTTFIDTLASIGKPLPNPKRKGEFILEDVTPGEVRKLYRDLVKSFEEKDQSFHQAQVSALDMLARVIRVAKYANSGSAPTLPEGLE